MRTTGGPGCNDREASARVKHSFGFMLMEIWWGRSPDLRRASTPGMPDLEVRRRRGRLPHRITPLQTLRKRLWHCADFCRLTALLAVVLCGCGYRVAGRTDALPAAIQTIAVPAFDNVTNRYRLSERLPGAITREFISRTRYRVVPDPKDADAVLRGSVINYYSFPNVTDQRSGRAAGIQVTIVLQTTLTDRAGTVLFTRPAMEFRQRYEIAVDQSQYFEESDLALDRLSRDVARTLVSSVLEAF